MEPDEAGPNLAADYARHKGVAVEGGLKAPEVIALAEAAAAETLRRFEDRLGRSLAVIVTVLDPDVIVLGGGLSNIARFYETVPPLVAAHVCGEARNKGSDSHSVQICREAVRWPCDWSVLGQGDSGG